jgi:hypothetical protein
MNVTRTPPARPTTATGTNPLQITQPAFIELPWDAPPGATLRDALAWIAANTPVSRGVLLNRAVGMTATGNGTVVIGGYISAEARAGFEAAGIKLSPRMHDVATNGVSDGEVDFGIY